MSEAILIRGNPVDGLTFLGPFDSRETAIEYAEVAMADDGGDWWVADLNKPEGD